MSPIADIGEQTGTQPIKSIVTGTIVSLFRRDQPMDTSTSFPNGFLITVQPERNAYGAWIARLNISRGGETVVDTRPETIQPEWSTEDEAIHDATEWGRRYIDHHFGEQQPRSWVVVRSRAEQWVEGIEERNAR
jgi:hypothetical protein